MVGLFSSLSGDKEGHRRSRSTSDVQESQNSEVNNNVPVIVSHGLETMAEFKPIDHLVEPPDDDRPVECPVPEPSMLNERRTWKERLVGNIRWLSDLSATKGDDAQAKHTSDDDTKGASPPSSSVVVTTLSGSQCKTSNQVQKCDLPEVR